MRLTPTTLAVATLACIGAAAAFSPVGSAVRRLAFQRTNNLALQRQSTPRAANNVVRNMSASPVEFTKTEIAGNKVVVFSKSYCPFCSSTKSLFKELGVDAKIYELDDMDNGNDIQAALLEISGQRTVPNVFVGGKHVGGNDNCQAANKSGELKKMLEEAGAL